MGWLSQALQNQIGCFPQHWYFSFNRFRLKIRLSVLGCETAGQHRTPPHLACHDSQVMGAGVGGGGVGDLMAEEVLRLVECAWTSKGSIAKHIEEQIHLAGYVQAALLLLTVLDVEACDLPHSCLHLSDVALLEFVLQPLSVSAFTAPQPLLQFILFELIPFAYHFFA